MIIDFESRMIDRIGACAFKECENLTEVTLPKSLKVIEQSAFEGCASLRSVTIPSSVERIEKRAFVGCRSLEEVIIPDATVEVGSGAFEGAGLKRAIAPRSANVASDAFNAGVGLYTKTTGGDDPLWGRVGGRAAKAFPADDGDVRSLVACTSVDEGSATEAADVASLALEQARMDAAQARLADTGSLAEYVRLASDAEANVLQLTESLSHALSTRRRIELARRYRDVYVYALREVEARERKSLHAVERMAIRRGDRLGMDELARIGEEPGLRVLEPPVTPREPAYERPGLFNRKQVEAKNEKARQQYHHQLADYHRAMRGYQFAVSSTQRARAEWQARRDAEIESQLAAFEESLRALMLEDKASQDDLVTDELTAAAKVADELCDSLRKHLADALVLPTKEGLVALRFQSALSLSPSQRDGLLSITAV